jgi:hypothetical protein
MPEPDPPPRPAAPSFREDDSGAAPATSRLVRGDYRPEAVVNPPPKFLPVSYRLPPDRMIDAVVGAFRAAGVLLGGIDRENGLVTGSEDMGGGKAAAVSVSVAATETGGSRLLLSYDRPPGTRMDPAADERRLNALLAKVDEALAREAGA